MTINVTKRNGTTEPLDLSKFHRVVQQACENLAGVSESEVEIKSKIQFYEGIKTSEIQETIIKSASDLISEDAPNYQYVASRLLNYQLRKEIYNSPVPPHLLTHVKKVVKEGYYDSEILSYYTEEEFEKLNKYIIHDRDFSIVYAGMEAWRGKYLVKNRVTGIHYETPQMAYMLISMILFNAYPKETRLKWVRDYYEAISTFVISLPTPILANLRTPKRQLSSCVLIETADSLDSIGATTSAIMKYVAQSAGIGIGAGAIRAKGSKVRNGDTFHTGVTPFYKVFQSAVRSTSQGGIRAGSGTLNVQIFHHEIEDILVLKNNKGTEETRVRGIDYCIQFNKLFYERLLSGGNITLFSPDDVKDAYNAFYSDYSIFKKLYEEAEQNPNIRKKTVSAIDLFSSFIQERKETGRIYLMNVDHANEHGSFNPNEAPIRMTNLCCVVGETVIDIMYKDSYDPSNAFRFVSDVRIDELEDWLETGEVLVKSYDNLSEEISYQKVIGWGMTGVDREVVQITEPISGHTLICTPDHGIFAYDDYVEAQKLPQEWNITPVDGLRNVYDITVENTSNFYANGILVHNCEITLPTIPMEHVYDENSLISLCTLSNINLGKIKEPKDFEKYCTLSVRGLDALLDYQYYLFPAAANSTKWYRPLGVGLTNLAYWLAKNDLTYDTITPEGLKLIHEYTEAWAYYLTKASVELAKEFGPCGKYENTKYANGILPIDTYKRDVDNLVEPVYHYDWDQLREDLKRYGIRNATLMAQPPNESSSALTNATNGVEPVRSLVSVKASKNGQLRQVVPQISKLKKKYNLLWDQKSPQGYLMIMAVLQKFMDQSISSNTSYNPKFYPDEEIPLSVLLGDVLFAYKMGLKTLYYNNTYTELAIGTEQSLPELAKSGVEADIDIVCEGCSV